VALAASQSAPEPRSYPAEATAPTAAIERHCTSRTAARRARVAAIHRPDILEPDDGDSEQIRADADAALANIRSPTAAALLVVHRALPERAGIRHCRRTAPRRSVRDRLRPRRRDGQRPAPSATGQPSIRRRRAAGCQPTGASVARARGARRSPACRCSQHQAASAARAHRTQDFLLRSAVRNSRDAHRQARRAIVAAGARRRRRAPYAPATARAAARRRGYAEVGQRSTGRLDGPALRAAIVSSTRRYARSKDVPG